MADQGAAYLEATRLAGFASAEARRFFGKPPALTAALERDYLTPWPADIGRAALSEALRPACAGVSRLRIRGREVGTFRL